MIRSRFVFPELEIPSSSLEYVDHGKRAIVYRVPNGEVVKFVHDNSFPFKGFISEGELVDKLVEECDVALRLKEDGFPVPMPIGMRSVKFNNRTLDNQTYPAFVMNYFPGAEILDLDGETFRKRKIMERFSKLIFSAIMKGYFVSMETRMGNGVLYSDERDELALVDLEEWRVPN